MAKHIETDEEIEVGQPRIRGPIARMSPYILRIEQYIYLEHSEGEQYSKKEPFNDPCIMNLVPGEIEDRGCRRLRER